MVNFWEIIEVSVRSILSFENTKKEYKNRNISIGTTNIHKNNILEHMKISVLLLTKKLH